MGYGVAYRTYHNVVIRKQINPNLPQFTADMANEVAVAFRDLLGSPEGLKPYTYWKQPNLTFYKDRKPIPLYEVIAMTVVRVSNKIFVRGDFCKSTVPAVC